MSTRQRDVCRQLLIAVLAVGAILAVVTVADSLCLGEETSTPQAPSVSIQAIPVRNSLERGESTPLSIIISNVSNVTLSNVKLLITPNDLVTEYDPAIRDLPPFATDHLILTVVPGNRTPFAVNTLVIEVQYTWVEAGTEFRSSAVNATTSITVKRRFTDELGGLLAGGAAALYFLLPILPAIAAYQFLDQLLTHKPVTFTSFSVMNFVPGLAASVLANVLVYQFIGGADILDPSTFSKVFGISFLFGAVIPSMRWVWSKYRWRKWGFHEDDQALDLLRKSLIGPYSKRYGYYERVKLMAGTKDTPDPRDTWEGLLLAENTIKDKVTYFLGKSFRVEIQSPDEHEEEIITDVIDKTGAVFNPKRIIQAIKEEKLKVEDSTAVKHGTNDESKAVYVVEGVYERKAESSQRIVNLPP